MPHPVAFPEVEPRSRGASPCASTGVFVECRSVAESGCRVAFAQLSSAPESQAPRLDLSRSLNDVPCTKIDCRVARPGRATPLVPVALVEALVDVFTYLSGSDRISRSASITIECEVGHGDI